MHASSFENMSRCVAKYLAGDAQTAPRMVLDIGGADVNGGYRSLFEPERYQYRTVDLAEGPGVDIALDDPYRLPLEDKSVDVVLSGQMLEHCEFFWLSFAEMMRVLKPAGFLFLIAPSAGPVHQYPVDCYRFYPDAYRALAKHAGCHLLECWLDERGPWKDLVGVFSWTPNPQLPPPNRVTTAPIDVPRGRDEEEMVSGALDYLDFLDRLHTRLSPSMYLEIGVRRGASLSLAQGRAIGVDPEPDLQGLVLRDDVEVVERSSDDFFRDELQSALPIRPDLAFIDGMHLFEFALRDFMHVERQSASAGLVVIDDVFPSHPAQAERTRRTRVWTGDIWKLSECLAHFRPDLVLIPIDTRPTGLLMIAGLDPASRILWEKYNPIVRAHSEEKPAPDHVLRRVGAVDPMDKRIWTVLDALRELRLHSASPLTVARRLKGIMADGRAA